MYILFSVISQTCIAFCYLAQNSKFKPFVMLILPHIRALSDDGECQRART